MKITAEQGIIELSRLLGILAAIMSSLSKRDVKPAYSRIGYYGKPNSTTFVVEFRYAGFELFCHAGLAEQPSADGLQLVEASFDARLTGPAKDEEGPSRELYLQANKETGRLEPKADEASNAPDWLSRFIAIEAALKGRNVEPDQAEEQMFDALAELLRAPPAAQ